jgi:hypothetical protein
MESKVRRSLVHTSTSSSSRDLHYCYSLARASTSCCLSLSLLSSADLAPRTRQRVDGLGLDGTTRLGKNTRPHDIVIDKAWAPLAETLVKVFSVLQVFVVVHGMEKKQVSV